jgi:predicted ABC-type ATPase
MRSGRKSEAQTKAPIKDRIKGSAVNKKGSASSTARASSILLSDEITSALSKKAKDFNEKYKGKKVSVSTLKAVFRRGAGAFSTSHRPNMTRNGWAYARVNKFLEKKAGKPVKAVYVQDDDLMEKGGKVDVDYTKGALKFFKKELDIKSDVVLVQSNFTFDPKKMTQTFGHATEKRGNKFYLAIDLKQSKNKFIRTLAHELVHIKQMEDNRLRFDGNMIIFDGEKMTYNEYLEKYHSDDIPKFEDEAFTQERELQNKYAIREQKYMEKGGELLIKDNGLLKSIYPKAKQLFAKNGLILNTDYAFTDGSNKSYLPHIGMQKTDEKVDKIAVTYYEDAYEVLGEFVVEIDDNGAIELELEFPNWGIDEELEIYENGGLVAPNGKLSNLTPEQYKLVRTPQFKAWFGDWENDPKNASKVVDENGEPLVVYHGTDAKFNEFSYNVIDTKSNFYDIIGFYFNAIKSQKSPYGKIVKTCFLNIRKQIIIPNQMVEKNPSWKTKPLTNEQILLLISDREPIDKKNYTKQGLIEILNSIDTIERQLIIIYNEFFSKWQIKDGIKLFLENLTEKLGYDGAYMPHSEFIVAFYPNQIKLADGTNTTFDMNNPDIRFAEGGLITNDNIEVEGLNNYTKTIKSGKFYNLFGKRKVNNDGNEYWWVSFSRKDGINKLGYVKYRNENDEEKFISLNELPKSLIEIYNNPDIKFDKGGLIAPNGKESNLTPDQYKLVRTPEFKAWFGDWENDPQNASKVLDENGEPLVVYRGDSSASKRGTIFKTGYNRLGYLDKDRLSNEYFFYFVDNYDVAVGYANDQIENHNDKIERGEITGKLWQPKVTSYFLNIRKIIDITPSNPLFITYEDYKKMELKKSNNVVNDTNYYIPKSYGDYITRKNLHDIFTYYMGDYFNQKDISEYTQNRLKNRMNSEQDSLIWSYFVEYKNSDSTVLWAIYNAFVNNNVDGFKFIERTNFDAHDPSQADLALLKENKLKFDYKKWKEKPIVYTALYPEQIKLADGTNTTFDMKNPDIRFKEGGQLSIQDNGLMDSIYPEIKEAFRHNGLKLEPNYAFTDGYNKMYLPHTGMQKTDGKVDRVAITYYNDGYDFLGEIVADVKEIGGVSVKIDFPDLQVSETLPIFAKGGDIDKVHEKLKEEIINSQFKEHKDIEKIAEEKGVDLDYAKEQFRKGMQTESEHSDDPMVQEIIALQHLDEMIDYYQKLEHIEGKSMDNGGELGQEITCVNCGWHWNTIDSNEYDKYLCHKCGFDNSLFYSNDIMAEGGQTSCEQLDSNGERKIDKKSIEILTKCINALPQTKSMHFNFKTNKYTSERHKLHKDIIYNIKKDITCIQDEQPIAILMGGSPASGKSTFLKKYSPYLLNNEILRVDADEIRSKLPEYKGYNATQTHLETKDIVNTLLSDKNIGLPCKFDIIYDGTMNSTKSYIPLINLLKGLGYKIFIVYIDKVPKDVIVKRALERYKKSGRFVPLEIIDDFFDKGKTALEELKFNVDGYMIIDGSNQDYKIISSGGMRLPKKRNYSRIGEPIKITKDDIISEFKRGGEIDPDNKKTKDMITHKSGNAGGLLVGNRHSEGGIKAVNKSTNTPLEMEGGEVVITRNAVSDNEKREFEGEMLTNREILSKINESGGGVSFENGGKIDYDCECDEEDDDDDDDKMSDGGELKISKGENNKYYWKFTFKNGKEKKSFDEFNTSADAQRDFQYRSKYFKMADGGEVKNMYVVFFSRMLNGKSVPRIYEMYNTKEEAQEYIESRKELGENGWKVKEAKDMPIYSMVNIVNQTKNIELSNFLHSKEKVDAFFNGKDSFYKKDYAWVKPYGYTWENWKLVSAPKMVDGGEIKMGDIVRIKNPLEDEDPNQLYFVIQEEIEKFSDDEQIDIQVLNEDNYWAFPPIVRVEKKDLEIVYDVENYKKMADGGKLDTHSELKQFFQEQNTPVVVEELIVEPIVEEIIEEEVIELPTEIMLYKEDLTSSDDFPMIYVGSSIYANNTNGSDEWVVKSFTNDGINLLHIPSNPLAHKHEDKYISFDELTKLFKKNAISIKFVLNERELNLILMIIKDKLQNTQSFKVGGFVMSDENGSDDEEIMKSQFGNKKF